MKLEFFFSAQDYGASHSSFQIILLPSASFDFISIHSRAHSFSRHFSHQRAPPPPARSETERQFKMQTLTTRSTPTTAQTKGYGLTKRFLSGMQPQSSYSKTVVRVMPFLFLGFVFFCSFFVKVLSTNVSFLQHCKMAYCLCQILLNRRNDNKEWKLNNIGHLCRVPINIYIYLYAAKT